MNNKISPFLKLALVAGLLFLYIPLFILVIYSFNDSKLVTVWGGFSTKWYGALLNNSEILEATWLSIRIALISSAAAVVLGTMAAYAMLHPEEPQNAQWDEAKAWLNQRLNLLTTDEERRHLLHIYANPVAAKQQIKQS